MIGTTRAVRDSADDHFLGFDVIDLRADKNGVAHVPCVARQATTCGGRAL
jgi:hypothetical protein